MLCCEASDCAALGGLRCIGRTALHWADCAALGGLRCIGRTALHWADCAALGGLRCIGRTALYWADCAALGGLRCTVLPCSATFAQLYSAARGRFVSAATIAMSVLYMPLVKTTFQLLSCRYSQGGLCVVERSRAPYPGVPAQQPCDLLVGTVGVPRCCDVARSPANRTRPSCVRTSRSCALGASTCRGYVATSTQHGATAYNPANLFRHTVRHVGNRTCCCDQPTADRSFACGTLNPQ
jgi:hypothetical protein